MTVHTRTTQPNSLKTTVLHSVQVFNYHQLASRSLLRTRHNPISDLLILCRLSFLLRICRSPAAATSHGEFSVPAIHRFYLISSSTQHPKGPSHQVFAAFANERHESNGVFFSCNDTQPVWCEQVFADSVQRPSARHHVIT